MHDPSRHPPNHRPRQDSLSVLLISDAPENDSRLGELLCKSSVEATLSHSQDLAAGLGAFHGEEPDVLVIDHTHSAHGTVEGDRAAAGIAPHIPTVVLTAPDSSTAADLPPGTANVEHLPKADLTPTLVGRTLRWAVEQHRLRRRVRRQEAQIQSIPESMGTATLQVTPSGQIETADEELVRLLGYERQEDVVGLDLTTCYTNPAHRGSLEAADTPNGAEVRIEHPDGSAFVGILSVAPLRDTTGTVRAYTGTVVDRTEQNEQEDRLHRQRNLLDQTQRLAGTWELDLRTDTQTWSDEVYRIFEVSPDTEVSVEDTLEFFLPDARAKLQKSIRRCAEEGTLYDLELPLCTAQGTRRWIRIVGGPSETEDGTVVQVAGAIQDISEQNQAEEELREHKAQLRGLTNSIPGVVFQAYARPNREYGFYHVTGHAEDLMGIARDPADFFERCLDRVPDAERDALLQTIDEAVDDEAPLRFETPFVRPSGEKIWLLGTATPEVRADEVVYNGVILDITERKRAEQDLERATDLLRHAGHMAKLGGWSTDLSGEPPYEAEWTEGLYDLFELPRDTEPPTDDVFKYYHPDDRERHIKAVNRAVEEGSGWDQKIRLITAAGTERWVRNIGRPITDDGEVVEVRGAIQDITDQKETEKELRWTKQYYEQILNQVPIDLAVFTPDAEFEYLNPKSVGDPEMREWLRGRTNEDYCHKRGLDPDMGRKRDEVIREAAHENKAIQFEETIDTGDGPRHYLRVHGPVTDLDGRITNVVAFGLDITERKEKEHRLREAKEEAERMNRLKSAFLANISHEIRTPLTSILGFAEAIGDELDDHTSGAEIDVDNLENFSELIQRSGRRLMDTLTSVLNLSRLEAGEMELTPTPIDLIPEAEEVAAQFHLQAQQAGVDLCTQTDASTIRAQADPGGLRIVLQNLLSNAIKYTEEGGRVELRVRSGPDGAIVEVEDTGIGMDPETTSQLFEAFKQASEGIGREYEGTGLGLTVAKEAVDRMNGSIEVDTAEGRGSCFTVLLPRPGTDGPAAPPADED